MARGGINKVVVQQARQALIARGENPSIDAIRIELGNTGSKTTIHRYLKELNGQQPVSAGVFRSPPHSSSVPLCSWLCSCVSFGISCSASVRLASSH